MKTLVERLQKTVKENEKRQKRIPELFIENKMASFQKFYRKVEKKN